MKTAKKEFEPWHNHFLPDGFILYFLFPVPIDRSSKLLSVSSRPPLVAAVRVKVVVLDSNPGWILWVVDRRPLLDISRLDRFSLGSPEELGRLLDTTGLFELLPLREELRPLSESGCRKEGKKEAVIGNQSARMTTWKTERDKLTEIIWKIVYYCSQLLTASLEDGTSSEDLCLKWSPCKPCPEPFLLANASTAPENLSRISCPTRRNI